MLIIIYSFSLCKSFHHKWRFIAFHIPFGYLSIFPLESPLSCRPIIAYCFGSIRNFFKVPNIVGIYRFYFMFLCFLPFRRVNAYHGFFKWGGITLYLNFFLNFYFLVIRNIWFSYSLRPSRASWHFFHMGLLLLFIAKKAIVL